MSYVGKIAAGGSTHPVGSMLYGTCSTSASSAAKAVVCPSFDSLDTGVTIHVKFTNQNTAASPTLNVNNTGAKPITGMLSDSGSSSTSQTTPNWAEGSVVSFTYDGTDWIMNDAYGRLSSYQAVTESELNAGTSTDDRIVTPKVIHDYVLAQMGEIAGALVYKGTVSSGSSLLNTALTKGWYYIVDTSGSYAGEACEPGDMIIVNTSGTYTTASALAAAVDVIQTNIDTISNSEIDTIVAS